MNNIIYSFFKLKNNEKRLIFEAFGLAIKAYFLFKIFSFRHYIEWIKKTPGKKKQDNTSFHQIAKAATRVIKTMHFPNRCVVQSVTIKKMLNKRGIYYPLNFGMKKEGERKYIAHAWIDINNEKGSTGTSRFYSLLII